MGVNRDAHYPISFNVFVFVNVACILCFNYYFAELVFYWIR